MRVLLVADRSPANFVTTDYELLASHYQVNWIKFRWTPAVVRRVISEARRADLIFGWFASHHTVLPTFLGRTLRKKVVIAAADYDLANEPWFKYGSMRGGVRAAVNNYILSRADLVLVPSAFSQAMALRNTVLKRMPDKLRILPLGFADWWKAPRQKERKIVTVGEVNQENWIRKGHREFVEVTKRLGGVPAYLVGRPGEDDYLEVVRRMAPPNLAVTGYVAAAELQDLLSRTWSYLQLSFMEGFGAAVAEAMLARCVPVVTHQGSLPEVVGDTGYYADYGDIESACTATRTALDDRGLGDRARERVLDLFPLERRRRELLHVLASL